MSDDINRIIEDMAANLLIGKSQDSVTRQTISETVKMLVPVAVTVHGGVVTDDDIQLIARRLEERFNITISLGALFAEKYLPWLADAKADIEWFYWDRYRRLLVENKFSPNVISAIDSVTDRILDHMEDPRKTNKWSRRGMVVGHVQSGKTANYIGLVKNKAADTGYRVIIVLAGTLNSLRSQTQERIDSGFLGLATAIPRKPALGVGLLARGKSPAYFTTSTSDFKKSVANSIGVGIEGLKEPAILVIKKNKSTLDNLIDWLKYSTKYNLKDYPMLLVDDEADHASINTRDAGEEATQINKRIRVLLNLFDRSAYVGYTATPFANVFIDPDTVDEMIGEDLFPRDFIVSLDPPSNYVGASRVFSSEADLSIVRTIDDYKDFLPEKHKKDLEVTELPRSCLEAVSAFVLARAIRLLRGQTNSHNSMLINVSRFTKVQSQVKLLVEDDVRTLLRAVINYSKLSESEALSSPHIGRIKAVWDKEYSTTKIEWKQVQAVLKDAISSIETIEVNSSASAASLDFSRRNYPKGRNVIAVGGLSLSRGLTLEGLTTSYFLRNSIMYDTLMQMGRWFGYRDGYADICRIYMSGETASWYGYISDVMEELREEFRRMQAAGMTPKDFGLAVRSHPDSLVVTARNKMRTGLKITKEIDLSGRLVETSALHRSIHHTEHNMRTMSWLINKAMSHGAIIKPDVSTYHYWRSVSSAYILDFLEMFRNHPAAFKTEKEPLKDYVRWLEGKGYSDWDVLLVNPGDDKYSAITKSICGLPIRAQQRKIDDANLSGSGNGVIIANRRVGTPALEKAGLPPAVVDDVERRYKKVNGKQTVPGVEYRTIRERPLLMLHLLDVKDGNGESIFEDGTAAYGISFPGTPGAKRPEKLVQYVVNTVWWNNMYSDTVEDSTDDLGIDE